VESNDLKNRSNLLGCSSATNMERSHDSLAAGMRNTLTGDVVMTFAWNGRVAGANRANNRKLKIAFEANHVSGSQVIAVMKGTPREDIGIELIKFASLPEGPALSCPTSRSARAIGSCPHACSTSWSAADCLAFEVGTL